MLKKVCACLLGAALMAPTLSLAEDSSDGCGLGWQVTNKKTMIATTTRGTTNAFVPPTFGMTTGTIGCEKHSFAKRDQKAIEYVASNYDSLMMDLAAGEGEYVEALAQTLSCGDVNQFGSVMRANYGQMMSAEHNAVELYRNIKAQVESHSSLAQHCAI